MHAPSHRLCSVVIPTRNEGDLLHMTVESILSQTRYPHFEIVVVDDGSTDGSCDRYRDRSRPASLERVRVATGTGVGVAGARNLGAAHARGAYLVFIDAHCTVSPNWIDCLVEALAPTDVGLVGPAFTRLHETAPRGCGVFWNDWALDIGWFDPQAMAEPYETPMTPGGCQAFRATNFARLGRYEPGFTTWGSEDIEICLRAWMLGYRVLADPRATVAHYFRESRDYHVVDSHVLYNLLRMVHLHLSPPRIERVRRSLDGQPGLGEALEMLERSDTAALRAAMDAVRVRDDDWYFETLLPQLRVDGRESIARELVAAS